MQTKFIIANDKGGVGKSTLAQFVALSLAARARPIRIVEYDRQPKLRRFFGDAVLSHSIGPEWERQFADGSALATFWDPLVKWFQVERPMVVDFGAQVWDHFQHWAGGVMLPEIIDSGRICLLVPVTADAEAVVAATRILDTAAAILPKARRVVLFCDKDGDVELLKGLGEYENLRAAIARGRVDIRRLPVLSREGYPLLASRGWRFDKIYRSKPVEVVHATGASLMLAARTITAVRAWVGEMDTALKDLFPTPAAPRPAPASVSAAPAVPQPA